MEINLTAPVTVALQSQQTTGQFLLALLLPSILTLYFAYKMFKPYILNISTYIILWKLKHKTKQHYMLIRHNGTGFLNQQMITIDEIPIIQKALTKFKGKPFNLILHTPGGEVFAALLISRIFKNYPGKIKAYIPQYAMSGGTMLALSCSKLFMDKHACLGPIDPQIGSFFDSGPAAGWRDVVKIKSKQSKDSSIIFKRLGNQCEKSISEHLLSLIHNTKAVAILTRGNYEHIYAFTPDKLSKIGIKSEPIPTELKISFNKLLRFKSNEQCIIYI